MHTTNAGKIVRDGFKYVAYNEICVLYNIIRNSCNYIFLEIVKSNFIYIYIYIYIYLLLLAYTFLRSMKNSKIILLYFIIFYIDNI